MWPRFASVLELDVSGLERAGGDNSSLGATEVELLRRLNLALDVDWPHYASVVKDQLATEVLARRPGPRRITIGVDDHPWVRKKAQQFVDEIREAGYHVVGDLADLLPLEEDLETGFPEPSDGELLDAAVDALARLVPRVPQEWPRNRCTPSRFFSISESGTHPRWRFAGCTGRASHGFRGSGTHPREDRALAADAGDAELAPGKVGLAEASESPTFGVLLSPTLGEGSPTFWA